jgi:sec-independent protein translocase protein TatA
MGSLGLPEIAFIVLIALLIFGPKKLPEIGRTLGRGMAEFRRATDELKRSINTELALDESPLPPVLRTRRIEDPVEQPLAAAPIPGETPQLTEPRTATPFPAAEPIAELVQPVAEAAPEPVAVPVPDLPEPPR